MLYIPLDLNVKGNSQIFGQLAFASGLEGILYSSKMSSKKRCLAVFIKNFRNSISFVKIQDTDLPEDIVYQELNSETYPHLF